MFKQIKSVGLIVAVFASAATLVACGKNKNNLKLDGSYEKEELVKTVDGRTVGLLTLTEIENNVETTYLFSEDRKSVEIVQEQLIVRGRNLIGRKVIADDCYPERVGGVVASNAAIQKGKGSLKISGKVRTGSGEEEVSDKTQSLNGISDVNKDLLKAAKAGALNQVCLNETGRVVRVIRRAGEAMPETAAATTDENKALDSDSDDAQSADQDKEQDKEQDADQADQDASQDASQDQVDSDKDSSSVTDSETKVDQSSSLTNTDRSGGAQSTLPPM